MSAIEASVVFFGIVRAADHTLAAVVLVYDEQTVYSVIVIYLVADRVIVLGELGSRTRGFHRASMRKYAYGMLNDLAIVALYY